ncbi:hypothetical protein Taro_042810 [Colocasia esculenta]|uniref:Uncharacterized protein n=1 Tax=Colocasia esculenta TaxID=4460 RepID=A0A843WPT8_COLES|nr:hypothetical protein [Colocasia esculenta]
MALTREEAEASNLVIGTLPILGRAARVLVDPSASLCFASEEFYESLVHNTPERQCDVMCVDTTTECVDTLSQLRKKGLLDAGSSVDTTTDCVDTLSQSDKWISWKLGLVSTRPWTVSTHLTLSS